MNEDAPELFYRYVKIFKGWVVVGCIRETDFETLEDFEMKKRKGVLVSRSHKDKRIGKNCFFDLLLIRL